MNAPADELLFDDSRSPETARVESKTWKLLIVDDEPGVHDVTLLALGDVRFEGRGIEFLHAYSAAEAHDLLDTHPDVAVMLLDVVMESEHAGLDLARRIRRDLHNTFTRIILRTGQPGQAPERQVTLDYDINDYKEKTELSAQKLFSCVVTALRGYRDIMALEKNRRGLEQVILSSSSLYETQSLEQFLSGVLTQIEALLNMGGNSFYSRALGILGDKRRRIEDQQIVAGTGEFAHASRRLLKDVVDDRALEAITEAFEAGQCLCRDDMIVIDLESGDGRDGLVYMSGCHHRLDDVDRHLIEIFASHASMALKNLYLNQEIELGQRELMFSLGEIAEFRSKETSRHVARVSKVCERLARLRGLPEEECNLVLLAASMHDVGKIAIADSILNKPGPLTESERTAMQSHCLWGKHLLQGSKRPLLRAAAVIAGQHHEKWDGSGYPERLKGEEIHIYGRIAALADVFDALCNKRCYKEAWSLEDVEHYIREQRGRHFDPELTDLFLDHFATFVGIREAYQD